MRTTRNLVVLFFYSFPSEFLIGLVPHEPVLLYYGATRAAWVVAVVAGIGTALAEWLNYSFLGFFNEVGFFARLRRKALVGRVTRLFLRAPFTAILVAGLTPLPFFPVRFLVVLEGYPVWKYVLGVLISRTPRFFLLAALGSIFPFPVWSLLILFAVMLVSLYLPVFARGPAAERAAGRLNRAAVRTP